VNSHPPGYDFGSQIRGLYIDKVQNGVLRGAVGNAEASGVAATDFAAAFRLRVSLALFAASLRFLAAAFAFRVAAAFTAAWLRFIASAFALRVAAALFAAALRFRVAAALLAAALRSVALFIARSITGKDDPGVVLRQFCDMLCACGKNIFMQGVV